MTFLQYQSSNTVCLLFAFLFIGLLTQKLLAFDNIVKLPYTVVLFVLGMLISLLKEHKSVKAWIEIDPIEILFVFLPILIFSDSMGMNWHKVKQSFIQSSLLATTGVVICAFLIGASFYGIIGLQGLNGASSFYLSMIFGSILSATDPVAVVALLKDFNVSSRLTMLITGESILNDGTAVVLFELYQQLFRGETFTFGEVCIYFLKTLLVSPLIGFLLSILAYFAMRSLNRVLNEQDAILQIVLSICLAYFSYYTAYVFSLSGILSVFGAGIGFSRFSTPLIIKEESLHNIWQFLEWSANTIIFIYAGLIFGSNVIEDINGADVGYLLLLYILLMVYRLVMVAVHYPIISKIGTKCDRNEALFMVWAGLRGALCILLALIVRSDTEHIDSVNRNRFFFFAGGLAWLTLIFNGCSSEYVLNQLELMGEQSRDRDIILTLLKKTVVVKAKESMYRFLDKFKYELDAIYRRDEIEAVHAECIKDVEEYCTIFKENLLYDRISEKKGSSKNSSSDFVELQDILDERASYRGVEAAAKHDLMAYIRTIFLQIVRCEYKRMLATGEVSIKSYIAQFLLFSIDYSLDKVRQGLDDFRIIKKEVVNDKEFILLCHLLTFMNKYLCFCTNKFIKFRISLEARKEKHTVLLLMAFITAHEIAQEKLHDVLYGNEDKSNYDVPQGLEEQNVIDESKKFVAEAREMLFHNEKIDRQVVQLILTKRICRLVLHEEVDVINRLVQNGFLMPNDAEKEFFTIIRHDAYRLERSRKKDQKKVIQERILSHMSTFSAKNHDTTDNIMLTMS